MAEPFDNISKEANKNRVIKIGIKKYFFLEIQNSKNSFKKSILLKTVYQN